MEVLQTDGRNKNSLQASPVSITSAEIVNIIRTQIEEEDELIAQIGLGSSGSGGGDDGDEPVDIGNGNDNQENANRKSWTKRT